MKGLDAHFDGQLAEHLAKEDEREQREIEREQAEDELFAELMTLPIAEAQSKMYDFVSESNKKVYNWEYHAYLACELLDRKQVIIDSPKSIDERLQAIKGDVDRYQAVEYRKDYHIGLLTGLCMELQGKIDGLTKEQK